MASPAIKTRTFFGTFTYLASAIGNFFYAILSYFYDLSNYFFSVDTNVSTYSKSSFSSSMFSGRASVKRRSGCASRLQNLSCLQDDSEKACKTQNKKTDPRKLHQYRKDAFTGISLKLSGSLGLKDRPLYDEANGFYMDLAATVQAQGLDKNAWYEGEYLRFLASRQLKSEECFAVVSKQKNEYAVECVDESATYGEDLERLEQLNNNGCLAVYVNIANLHWVSAYVVKQGEDITIFCFDSCKKNDYKEALEAAINALVDKLKLKKTFVARRLHSNGSTYDEAVSTSVCIKHVIDSGEALQSNSIDCGPWSLAFVETISALVNKSAVRDLSGAAYQALKEKMTTHTPDEYGQRLRDSHKSTLYAFDSGMNKAYSDAYNTAEKRLRPPSPRPNGNLNTQ